MLVFLQESHVPRNLFLQESHVPHNLFLQESHVSHNLFLQESHVPHNLFQIPECVFSLIELVVFWASTDAIITTSTDAIITTKGLKNLFKIEHKLYLF